MQDWFWTRRFHSLVIGGNGGALIMLAGFISTYDDPLLRLKDYMPFMGIFVSGLFFAAMAAYIGMEKEFHLFKASQNKALHSSGNKIIHDDRESVESLVAANARVKKLSSGKSDVTKGANWMNIGSGVVFLIGCLALYAKVSINP